MNKWKIINLLDIFKFNELITQTFGSVQNQEFKAMSLHISESFKNEFYFIFTIKYYNLNWSYKLMLLLQYVTIFNLFLYS